ncbi:endonuclease III domain-containing protein [Pediococcus ethanolidurans]|uniref:endonuclease III domain-containing protein n=1 Tax=Pediococcus ethanolidurans TaxID=319653 RepID=UPI0029558EA7|nr:DNA-3-methyladenine glycosylase [Pediococcus ethanolidurans]
MKTTVITLNDLYNIMETHMGHQTWLQDGTDWAESPWEVIYGAILVQNTNWQNVAPSLLKLKSRTNFDPQQVAQLDLKELTDLIRTSGFYTRKTQTIYNICHWLEKYHFDLAKIKTYSQPKLRHELINLKGIGNETADYILMYVLDKPNFMVDAYSRRLFGWLGCQLPSKYTQAQDLIESQVTFNLEKWQNFHALIVNYGKTVKNKAAFEKSFLYNYQDRLKLNK